MAMVVPPEPVRGVSGLDKPSQELCLSTVSSQNATAGRREPNPPQRVIVRQAGLCGPRSSVRRCATAARLRIPTWGTECGYTLNAAGNQRLIIARSAGLDSWTRHLV